MLPCISYSSDILPTSNTNNNNSIPISKHQRRTRRFSSREAFFHLETCSSFKQLKQIHTQIIRNGMSQDQFLLAQLIRLSPLDYATLVFYQIQHPLTFTWNLIIRAHTLNSSSHQALRLYNLMITHGTPPDKFTFPFVIKACLLSSALPKGKEVHAFAIKSGFTTDLFFQNILMDLYFKCGDVGYGRKVFDKMRVRSVVSWTTMLTGLASSGELEAAREVFERMPLRNVVSWTAMINGYVRNHQPHEAFRVFQRMQVEEVMPNEFTLVGLLVACTEVGNLILGRRIHEFIVENRFELGVFLGTALVDMYSKCGSIVEGKKVFDKMERKSLATWNTMITSLGVHGQGMEALTLFAQMEKENVRPDEITFFGVLSAFMHLGAVDEGCRYFKYMTEHYGIIPTVAHYSCIVELMCRARRLDEAYQLIQIMPVKPNDEIWCTLLRESRKHGHADLEEVAYRHIGDSTSATTFSEASYNFDGEVR